MQSVRFVLRTIGTPDGKDILSGQDVSDYLEYQYLSNGYKVQATHYLGPVSGDAGYRILIVMVKNEDPEPALVVDAVEKVKAKK